MSQPILQCLLICPVGSLLNSLEMRMCLAQTCVKHCHLHPSTSNSHLPQDICLQNTRNLPWYRPQELPVGMSTSIVPEGCTQGQTTSAIKPRALTVITRYVIIHVTSFVIFKH